MSLVGLVGRLLANTATYVTDRKQFGVPVGSFQAIKHSLAEVYIELTHARSLTLGALDALDRGDAEASRLLSLSKAAANAIAEESLRCLQAMGGVGFTWESDVHLFVKQSLPASSMATGPSPLAFIAAHLIWIPRATSAPMHIGTPVEVANAQPTIRCAQICWATDSATHMSRPPLTSTMAPVT